MLNSRDIFNIRNDLQQARADYRDVHLVHVTLTSGSNYEQFTDGPMDISKDSANYLSPVFTVYRTRARVKIINPITLLGLGPVITGVEVGDYLLMFRTSDKEQVDRVVAEKRAYKQTCSQRTEIPSVRRHQVAGLPRQAGSIKMRTPRVASLLLYLLLRQTI